MSTSDDETSGPENPGTESDVPPPPAPVPLWPPPFTGGAARQGPIPRIARVQRIQPKDSLGRPLATWVKRVLAFLIDFFLLVIVLDAFANVVFPNVISSTNSAVAPSSQLLEFYGVTLTLWIGYLGLFGSSTRGQTIGMMFYGIAVRDERDGGQVRVGRAALRSVILIVLFGFFIDSAWPLWDPKRQSLHDKAARTVVVDVRMARLMQGPPPEQF